jgi:aspartyl-tRNA(Asn)/glutamyl-tRNA(Gln) amidotransferase subunit A
MYPTYGRVSRWGLIAYASSFDQAGPLTSSMEDMALILSVISGPDEHDASVIQCEGTRSDLQEISTPLKLAYLNSCIEHPGLDVGIKKTFQQTIDLLKKHGHTVSGVEFDMLDALVPAYYVLTTAEASSNLSRYSGLTHGYRSKGAKDLESTFKRSRTEGFGEEVKRRIMLGTFVLSSDYYDAYYTKAQKVRRLIREKTLELLNSFDAIVIPTTSSAAFKIGEKANDPIAMYLADLFTVQSNLAGTPAVSIPYAIHPDSGLPIGLQIIGKPLNDEKVMSIGQEIMKICGTKGDQTLS